VVSQIQQSSFQLFFSWRHAKYQLHFAHNSPQGPLSAAANMKRAEALEVLSVSDDTDVATVRSAYRAMAMKHHPGASNTS
jgi:DnaJ-class molecular chaperone